MVEGPDLEKAVFVRGLAVSPIEVEVEGTDTAFVLRRGDVVVCRWVAVKEIVMRGEAELI